MSSKFVTPYCTPGLENCASLKTPRLDDDARNSTLDSSYKVYSEAIGVVYLAEILSSAYPAGVKLGSMTF